MTYSPDLPQTSLAKARKAEQSRQNGRKSKGPKTAEGKARSLAQLRAGPVFTPPPALLAHEDAGAFELMTAAYVSFHQPATQPEFDAIHHLVAAELELRRCSVIRHGLFLEQMDRADRSARSSILPAAQASMVAAFESLATERSVLSQLTRQQRHFAQEITRWENPLAELRALAPLTGRAQEALLIEHLARPVPTPDSITDPITDPTSEPSPNLTTSSEPAGIEPRA